MKRKSIITEQGSPDYFTRMGLHYDNKRIYIQCSVCRDRLYYQKDKYCSHCGRRLTEMHMRVYAKKMGYSIWNPKSIKQTEVIK